MNLSLQPYNEKLPTWLKNVRPDVLPEVYREMSELIGVEPTIHLAMVFAGSSVYFPKLERALLGMRNQVIRHEFNGANIKELSRRWGLSARHVRQIVNPAGRKRNRPETS